MGCGVSKLEPGEGPASGQVTRRRQNDGSPANKDGTVSASLLRPEELDDAAPPVADGKATMTTQVESKCARQEQGEGQDKQQQRLSQNKRAGSTGEELQDKMSQGDTKKREGEGAKRASYSRGPALNDGRRARSGDDEEEFPGSPSFRVYFVEPAPEFSDDDSVISAISSAGKIKGRKCIIPTGEDSMKPIISEESVEKVSKRQWRRFKGLSRKPAGGVYSLLNVRSLYSSPNAGCHQEGGLPHTTNTAGGGAGRTSNAGPP